MKRLRTVKELGTHWVFAMRLLHTKHESFLEGKIERVGKSHTHDSVL